MIAVCSARISAIRALQLSVQRGEMIAIERDAVRDRIAVLIAFEGRPALFILTANGLLTLSGEDLSQSGGLGVASSNLAAPTNKQIISSTSR
jgi:hypothetical protein